MDHLTLFRIERVLYGIHTPNLKVSDNLQFVFYYIMMIILAIVYVEMKFNTISRSFALGIVII